MKSRILKLTTATYALSSVLVCAVSPLSWAHQDGQCSPSQELFDPKLETALSPQQLPSASGLDSLWHEFEKRLVSHSDALLHERLNNLDWEIYAHASQVRIRWLNEHPNETLAAYRRFEAGEAPKEGAWKRERASELKREYDSLLKSNVNAELRLWIDQAAKFAQDLSSAKSRAYVFRDERRLVVEAEFRRSQERLAAARNAQWRITEMGKQLLKHVTELERRDRISMLSPEARSEVTNLASWAHPFVGGWERILKELDTQEHYLKREKSNELNHEFQSKLTELRIKWLREHPNESFESYQQARKEMDRANGNPSLAIQDAVQAESLLRTADWLEAERALWVEQGQLLESKPTSARDDFQAFWSERWKVLGTTYKDLTAKASAENWAAVSRSNSLRGELTALEQAHQERERLAALPPRLREMHSPAPGASVEEALAWKGLVQQWENARAGIERTMYYPFEQERRARHKEEDVEWERAHLQLRDQERHEAYRKFDEARRGSFHPSFDEFKASIENERIEAMAQWAEQERQHWDAARNAGQKSWNSFVHTRYNELYQQNHTLENKLRTERHANQKALDDRYYQAEREHQRLWMERQDKEMKAAKAEYEERMKKEREETERAVAELLPNLKREDTLGQALRDQVANLWLDHLSRSQFVSALLIGDPYRAPEGEDLQAIRGLVEAFAKSGLVVYDADSASAQAVSDAAGDRGLGISGNPANERLKGLKHVLVLSNPYMRMKAFSRGVSVMTPGSVTGLGLAIHQKVNFVFDPQGVWKPGLQEFEHSLNTSATEVNMGLSYARSGGVYVLRSQEDVVRNFGGVTHGPSRIPSLDIDYAEVAAQLDHRHILVVTEWARGMADAVTQLEKLPGGAVVFGGSRLASQYTQLVYESVSRLAEQGVPVVTGGAGGYMEVANTAAFNAGADSVGIPMVGGKALRTEQYTPTSTQTMTLGASDYESRIPLLLERRQLIVLAPGGSGTMKELATAMVHLAAHPDSAQKVVFLSSGYYGKLVEWIRGGAFPSQLIEKIRMIGASDEAAALVAEQEKILGPNRVGELKSPTPPAPRKKAERFEPSQESLQFQGANTSGATPRGGFRAR